MRNQKATGVRRGAATGSDDSHQASRTKRSARGSLCRSTPGAAPSRSSLSPASVSTPAFATATRKPFATHTYASMAVEAHPSVPLVQRLHCRRLRASSLAPEIGQLRVTRGQDGPPAGGTIRPAWKRGQRKKCTASRATRPWPLAGKPDRHQNAYAVGRQLEAHSGGVAEGKATRAAIAASGCRLPRRSCNPAR